MLKQDLTLYKLIVLYMLDNSAAPLTKGQIEAFVLGRNYTTYINLQTALSELKEESLIDYEKTQNRTLVTITEDGGVALEMFIARINHSIRDDVGEYLKDNQLKIQSQAAVNGSYELAEDGSYRTRLYIRERDRELMSIVLSMPSEELAVELCENWREKAGQTYEVITELLFT